MPSSPRPATPGVALALALAAACAPSIVELEPTAGPFAASTFDAHARYMRIAVAAYYNAETRGFSPGRELDDWLDAEKQIDKGQ